MKTKYGFLKAIIILILGNLFFVSNSFGQVPEKMTYQAVIRDENGNLVVNQDVNVRLSILQGASNGTVVYQETHYPTTNDNGLITVELGGGTVVSGSFSGIDWSDGPYYLKTEVDPTGGQNFSVTGTSQLLSVPYALYALNAANTENAANYWSINGNSGIEPGTNFIGTTDNNYFEIRTDNEPKIRITTKGQIAILNSGKSICIGDSAGENESENKYNVFVGEKAGFNTTTGSMNLAFGYETMYNNTTGYYNVALGYHSLFENTTGRYNLVIGPEALYSNTTGVSNVALGYLSLHTNIDGNSNIAIGNYSLNAHSTKDYNVAIGVNTLKDDSSGTGNTAIGTLSLRKNKTGSLNTAVGYRAFYDGTDYTNSTAIGYNAEITASNQIRLGNSSVTSIGGFADWTNVSDKRFKKDVKENVHGLDFIMKLRPVTYRLDMDAIAKFLHTPDDVRLKEGENIKGQMVWTGFIAQEVEQAAKEVGYQFSGIDKPKGENDYYGLRYAEFVVPLVKAVQEQQEIINRQQKEIDALKKQNKEILRRLSDLENK